MGIKLLDRLIKTESFYGHGLPYKPREILRRLGVEGRVLIVGAAVKVADGWKSGQIKYIQLWPHSKA